MTRPFRPMLAELSEVELLRFPLLASPKLDGVRTLAMQGSPKSRSMKPIPNQHVQTVFAKHANLMEGLDGELIVGPPNAEDVCRRTVSATMTQKGSPEFTYHIFDKWNAAGGYQSRLEELEDTFNTLLEGLGFVKGPEGLEGCFVKPVQQVIVNNIEELDAFELECLELGYEGVMVRSLDGPYKQGRSTLREGYLLKIKRFSDGEAEVIGYEELQHNENEATVDDLGYTKRSTHKANQSESGLWGAALVRGVGGPFDGVEFKIGSGYDHKTRREFWENREDMLGVVFNYRYFEKGVMDKPRHPIFHSIRDRIDMS